MPYDNTNRGILGVNRKRTNDRSPDMTGTLDVGGQEYFIDGWTTPRKDGNGSFISIKVKLKEVRTVRQTDDRGYGGQQREQTRQAQPVGSLDDLSDEIPW